jgi:hypothetical protein
MDDALRPLAEDKRVPTAGSKPRAASSHRCYHRSVVFENYLSYLDLSGADHEAIPRGFDNSSRDDSEGHSH